MVAPNGIYKLAVIGTVLGQQHVHTLHFRSTVAGASVGATEEAWQQELIDTWQTECRTLYRAMFWNNDYPCQNYQVRKVCGSLPLPGGVDEGETPGSDVGSRAFTGIPLGPWLAQVVTIRSRYAGRKYRGRNFLGGMGEDDVAGATISAGRITTVTAYYTELQTTFVTPADAAVNHKMFVFSRLLAKGDPTGTPPVPPAPCQDAGADVLNFQVRSTLATMKSRKAGSGI